MDTTSTTGNHPAPDTSISERVRLINVTADRLLEVAMSDSPDSIIEDAATLIKCGLVALTEIADAQQRIAATGERDIQAAIEEIAGQKAERIATELNQEASTRSFIGKKG
jgi:hypothetical protein